MAKWAVVVSPEQYEAERIYGAGAISVPGVAFGAGDEALLVGGGDEPVVFGLARADTRGALQYTVRLLDSPLPVGKELGGEVGARRVDEAAYVSVARQAGTTEHAAERKRTWLVSVDLPIEAVSPGEAVRAFWSHVRELGPAELPAYVWPSGNELAMQAFVLGAEANQDPEEE